MSTEKRCLSCRDFVTEPDAPGYGGCAWGSMPPTRRGIPLNGINVKYAGDRKSVV